MEDLEIVKLYWEKSLDAISHTKLKYGSYCTKISLNILKNDEDAEECVNDTYLKAWNSMPPQRPDSLKAFLGRITRNLSLSRYRSMTAIKRGGTETELILSEIGDIVSGRDTVEGEIERKELMKQINSFLTLQDVEKRKLFVRRYWYMDSIEELSEKFNLRESRISSILFKMRKELKQQLLKEGVEI